MRYLSFLFGEGQYLGNTHTHTTMPQFALSIGCVESVEELPVIENSTMLQTGYYIIFQTPKHLARSRWEVAGVQEPN